MSHSRPHWSDFLSDTCMVRWMATCKWDIHVTSIYKPQRKTLGRPSNPKSLLPRRTEELKWWISVNILAKVGASQLGVVFFKAIKEELVILWFVRVKEKQTISSYLPFSCLFISFCLFSRRISYVMLRFKNTKAYETHFLEIRTEEKCSSRYVQR